MSDTTTSTVDDAATTADEPEATTDNGEEQLGDAGKKALDAMKAERNALRKEARDQKAMIAQLEADKANASKPAEEQALERAKAEGRAEALKTASQRVLRSELRSAAKGKLTDPEDAFAFVDLDSITVSDDGEVDPGDVEAAIDDLLKRKPHLAAEATRRFTGTANQGAKGKTAPPPKQDPNELLRAAWRGAH